eukprot:scaffold62549_cov23-Tisochrysis_lutea.AAC.2
MDGALGVDPSIPKALAPAPDPLTPEGRQVALARAAGVTASPGVGGRNLGLQLLEQGPQGVRHGHGAQAGGLLLRSLFKGVERECVCTCLHAVSC